MRNKLLLLLAILTLLLVACGKRYRTIQGPQGNTGAKGEKGDQGNAGANGNDGQDGFNSLVKTQRYNSGLALCTSDAGIEVSIGKDLDRDDILDNSEVTQVNAVCDGNEGPAGSSSYDIVDVIDPCGNQSSFDEVLLKTSGGQLIAHFASGTNQFLTIIGNGNYVSTDGTHCYFTVTNGTLSNEHN